jgi:hypothetical protein
MATRHTRHRDSSAHAAEGRTSRRSSHPTARIAAATAALLAVSLAPSVANARPLPLPSLACDPVACGAAFLNIPADRLQAELTEDARTADGTVVELLLARVDAVAEVRLAHAGRTDGPQQVAAMLLIRQQQAEIRALIVLGAPAD